MVSDGVLRYLIIPVCSLNCVNQRLGFVLD